MSPADGMALPLKHGLRHGPAGQLDS